MPLTLTIEAANGADLISQIDQLVPKSVVPGATVADTENPELTPAILKPINDELERQGANWRVTATPYNPNAAGPEVVEPDEAETEAPNGITGAGTPASGAESVDPDTGEPTKPKTTRKKRAAKKKGVSAKAADKTEDDLEAEDSAPPGANGEDKDTSDDVTSMEDAIAWLVSIYSKPAAKEDITNLQAEFGVSKFADISDDKQAAFIARAKEVYAKHA